MAGSVYDFTGIEMTFVEKCLATVGSLFEVQFSLNQNQNK